MPPCLSPPVWLGETHMLPWACLSPRCLYHCKTQRFSTGWSSDWESQEKLWLRPYSHPLTGCQGTSSSNQCPSRVVAQHKRIGSQTWCSSFWLLGGQLSQGLTHTPLSLPSFSCVSTSWHCFCSRNRKRLLVEHSAPCPLMTPNCIGPLLPLPELTSQTSGHVIGL